ncbi:MAG: penicillin-binding protein 2 [Alphaproteobacteria bacterium]
MIFFRRRLRTTPERLKPLPLPPEAPHMVRLDGASKAAMDTGRTRLFVTGVVMGTAFLAIAGRLVDVSVFKPTGEMRFGRTTVSAPLIVQRGDITDRNGVLLATSLPTASLYADARRVLDPAGAATRLAQVLPGLDVEDTHNKLASGKSFVWIRRNLTPREHFEVNRLGIPGLDFQREERRVYPQGQIAAHVLGFTDIDGYGISGVERVLDQALRENNESVRLSIDIRLQHLVREELRRAMGEFQAIGATGIILDANNGEVLALESLPDFDPNAPASSDTEARFNRATLGVYEMGSTFKIFNTAMALDSGTTSINAGYDASHPIQVARFTIRDDHPKARWLSVPEIFMYSSNIGSVKMALDAGTRTQQAFLKKMGMLDPVKIELPEVGMPMVPSPWREINTMTIAFGHGIAVTPLHLASGVATVVNGGTQYAPTLIRRAGEATGNRVISAKTSATMRKLMRLVVEQGTGKQANVPGYLTGGKTGTAEKASSAGYRRKALISSFVGAFPMNDPKYVVLVMLDEPKGNRSTYGFASGGWTAAPTMARIVNRMAPMVGIPPIDDAAPQVRDAIAIDLNSRGRTLASY